MSLLVAHTHTLAQKQTPKGTGESRAIATALGRFFGGVGHGAEYIERERIPSVF